MFIRIIPIILFLLGLVIAAPRAQLLTTGAGKGVSAAAAPYTPQGVAFSGGAYGSAGVSMAGVSNGPTALFSAWFNNPNATGSQHTLLGIASAANNYLTFYISSASLHFVTIGSSSTPSNPTSIINGVGTTNFTSMGSTWAWVGVSVNMTTPRCQAWTNTGGSDTNEIPAGFGTCTSGTTIAYTSATANYLGAAAGAFGPFNANIADVQFWPNVDLDISLAANRRYFIDASGKAVDPQIARNALGAAAMLNCSGAASGICSGAFSASTWLSGHGNAIGFSQVGGTVAAASSNPP